MAKKTLSTKKRKEPHMIVRELPDGLREVTVDGHTWIEGPYTPEPPPMTDDDRAAQADPRPSGLSDRDHTGPVES
jgi:hypothetical protein